MEFESVIGLEVHVQLLTNSKMFCASSAAFGAEPNEYIDAYTLGLPGSLPVTNLKGVEFAIMLGLALNCQVRHENRLARKHYFYPDLPKGYQISQYEEPICERGRLEIEMNGKTRTIGITRVHMEEDAGKNIHDSRTHSSLVDLNRAGVPLLEVVSEPDIRSAEEASTYLKVLRQIVRWLGISDGNMEEGSLRCDANISLRPRGSMKFGTRAEVKNMNSFRHVEHAIDYEIARQASVIKGGGTIVQETRLYDPVSGSTHAMRGKEESADYRYFPDPDIPPLRIEESWVAAISEKMPKLPHERKMELITSFGLSDYDSAVLTADRQSVEFFEEVNSVCGNAKAACNWVTTELFGALKKAALGIEKSPVSATSLGELIKLIDSDVISGKIAKGVFEEMFETGQSPEAIVSAKGLKQIDDDDSIREAVLRTFEENPDQLKKFMGGNDKLLGFFVGQVMKLTGGSAHPKKVNALILAELEKLKS